jgi:hypothetical protein
MKTSTKFAHMAVFAGLFVCFNALAQNVHASDVAKSRAHGVQGCVQSEQSCDMPMDNKSMKSEEKNMQKPNQGDKKMAHKQAKKHGMDNKMKGKHKNLVNDVEGVKPMNPKW